MKTMELDSDLVALADDACQWLFGVAFVAGSVGISVPEGVRRWHESEAARERSVRHASIRDGLRPVPKRETAADRLAKTAQAFFGSRRLLAGEMA